MALQFTPSIGANSCARESAYELRTDAPAYSVRMEPGSMSSTPQHHSNEPGRSAASVSRNHAIARFRDETPRSRSSTARCTMAATSARTPASAGVHPSPSAEGATAARVIRSATASILATPRRWDGGRCAMPGTGPPSQPAPRICRNRMRPGCRFGHDEEIEKRYAFEGWNQDTYDLRRSLPGPGEKRHRCRLATRAIFTDTHCHAGRERRPH